ncbi:hypothetical protein GXW78_12460 [Roseomonas terrae]|uniref:DoxX family protein n=1 Tax=Neoroseomonas terrae TaxID=424799 RepID=A0ABS5EHH5_9PROT|nr:hypothetical protein [Neoroseomonas terrae]MBR0650479.1 hypothetical protein [Neoroseomonas terrae]
MIRRLAVDVPRVLLGLLFLVGALDGFYWMATGQSLVQPPTSAAGLRFEDALKDSGFLWPLMKVVDLIAAIGLLTNRAPAAALLLLLPIITVIILFHIVLNPQGMPVAILLALMTGTMLYAYRDRYAALLR